MFDHPGVLSGLPILQGQWLASIKTPWRPLTAYSDELAPDSNGIPRYVRTVADFLQEFGKVIILHPSHLAPPLQREGLSHESGKQGN
jgi:hypothetical protein